MFEVSYKNNFGILSVHMEVIEVTYKNTFGILSVHMEVIEVTYKNTFGIFLIPGLPGANAHTCIKTLGEPRAIHVGHPRDSNNIHEKSAVTNCLCWIKGNLLMIM